jgi:hypothetical protein
MDSACLRDYIGKRIKLVLLNGYYFKGSCLDVTDKSLVLTDINSKRVVLDCSSIMTAEEVS